MTQEEKEILIKDITARLSYGLKVQIDFGEHCIKYGIDRYVDDTVICVWPETFEIGVNDEDQACDIEDVKPYLRSMSSMTEEEKIELCIRAYAPDEMKTIDEKLYVIQTNAKNATDFYNEHHLDYRGLIPMGLAIEATKDMYAV